MARSSLLVKELTNIVADLGLNRVDPVILSDAGNLIVHLSPYPSVARIAKHFDGDEAQGLKANLESELEVVRHLKVNNVPVAAFSTDVSPGPYKIGSTWMTLWDYVEKESSPPLLENHLIDLLDQMTQALETYPNPLTELGAWNNVIQGAAFLERVKLGDPQIENLLKEYKVLNEQLKTVPLFPSHGDAHPNNLIPSSTGWRWIDFEDVSLMPRFWDFASFVSNPTLFEGFSHPFFQKINQLDQISENQTDFYFALKARVIMSVTTNLALALDGHGDLEFANDQLTRFRPYLDELKMNFDQ